MDTLAVFDLVCSPIQTHNNSIWRYMNMKAFDLTGRVAIVTGGNGGIGLGMSRGLAAAGATVAIAGRNMDKTNKAVEELTTAGGKALALEVDVTSAASVEAMVAEAVSLAGRLDILVNNAGMNNRKRPEDLSDEEWNEVMETNLTSMFRCSKAVYPEMKKVGGGKILNNGSMKSLFADALTPVYAASKGGVVQLTKSLAAAWAADNIQVNAFLPGWVDTDLTRKAREQIPTLNENVLRRTAQGRWGDIDDFQGIAVFLASQASNFITGTAIPVDGGYSSVG